MNKAIVKEAMGKTRRSAHSSWRAGGVNIHIYPTAFTHETRILKITRSLAERSIFDRVIVLATSKPGLPEVENLDERRQVWRVRTKLSGKPTGAFGKALRVLGWSARSLWRTRGLDVRCVNAHSLSSLPLAVLLKVLAGGKLVYDTHELETETSEMRGLRKALSKKAESVLIRRADAVSVVSDGIQRWYLDRYQLGKVWVMKNLPYACTSLDKDRRTLRERLGLADGDILFIYQGAIVHGRGCELILGAFSRLPCDRHILFLGFGNLVDAVTRCSLEHPNVHFQPAVPPEEVAAVTGAADVGIHLMENTCLNHYHALPNKVMEYLSAGIPAIVSDFPDMGGLVSAYHCGWRVPPSEEALVSLVRVISKAEIASKQEGAFQWARENTWEAQEPELLDMYCHVFADSKLDAELRPALTSKPWAPTTSGASSVHQTTE